MGTKKVEFRKVSLYELGTDKEISYKKLKPLFQNILKKHGIDNDKCSSIDLDPDITASDVKPKLILDVLRDDNETIFGRICRQKDRTAILRRDYETLKARDVLTNSQAVRVGIETFTYFILEYKTGILSIVMAKDVPGASSLNKLFLEYSKYYISLENIPNKNGIELFYESKSPEISQFEFDIANPDAELLQKVLKIDEKQLIDTIKNGVKNARIILKAEPYKKIETDKKNIKRALTELTKKKNCYENVRVKGRSEDFDSHIYDLQDEYFSYPIKVKTFHSVDGKQVEYSLDEVTKQFQDGIKKAFEEYRELIVAIAKRDDGDD